MDENKFIAENPTSTTSEEVAPRPKREAGGIPKILGFTRTYNALLCKYNTTALACCRLVVMS